MVTLRRDTNKTRDNNAISTSTSGPGKHHIRGIISEIILLSDCFVYCWGVCVIMSPVCHARRPASVHACVHVFRHVWLTTFQLFQHRVSLVKVEDLLCGILLQTNQSPGLADQVVSWVLVLLGFLWQRSGCGQMMTTHVAWFGTKRMLILNYVCVFICGECQHKFPEPKRHDLKLVA